MIHLYFGENDFTIRQQIDAVTAKFVEKYGTNSITKIDALSVDPQRLLAEIVNINLFAQNRLIVLSNATKNKSVWDVLGDNLSRVPNETELVIVEPSPDKRTKTFKQLQKNAKVREFKLPKNRDLLDFVLKEAADNSIEIKRDAADELIIYTGGNPWRIDSEIAKFKALGSVITRESIQDLVEPELSASAFKVLDDLLSGRQDEAKKELVKLRQIEDANRFLGLLASQIFALAVATSSKNRSNGEVSKETGIHPFVMEKMLVNARRIDQTEVTRIAKIVAETDAKIKSSGTDPWTLIEIALIKI